MSIERNLRRAAGGGSQPDPYWANVSLLINTTGPTESTNSAYQIIDATGNTTITKYGLYVRSGANSPFPNYYGSYYNLGDAQVSGGITTGGNSLINFTGDFTVEFWAMVPAGTSQSGYPSPIITTSNYGFFSNGPVSNTWVATARYGGMSWDFVSSITSNDGVWRHIALVRNGTSTGNLKLYIDGVNIPGSTTTQTTAYNSTFNWSNFNIGCGIGTNPGAGDNQYFGYLANMRFSNIARYTSNFTPATAPFTVDSNTMFLATMIPGMYDVSNNKFPLYNYPDPAAFVVADSTFQKFSGVYSLYSTTVPTPGHSTSLQIPLGQSSYVPTTTSMTLSGDFTIDLWVYIPLPGSLTQKNYATIFTNNPAPTGPTIYLSSNWYGQPSNEFILLLNNGSTVLNTHTISNDGAWHFIAITRSGSTVTVYVDGVSKATGTDSNTYDCSNFQIFGVGVGDPQYQFIGHMSQVRVTKGVVRYTTTFTPPSAPFPDN